MAVAILNLVIMALQATILVVTEIFEGQKRARLANEKFELDKTAIADMYLRAFQRIKDRQARESQDAQRLEDRIDSRKKP